MKDVLAMAIMAFLMTGCGGGGGAGSAAGGGDPTPVTTSAPPLPLATTPDVTAPTFVAVQPSTTQRVPRNTDLWARFSEALRADTVTDATLRLSRAGVAAAGTLAYDTATFTVRFMPQRPLDLLANYTVTAGTGITDLSGNGLAAERAWSFRTQDGAWQGAQRLDPAIATSVNPDVAVDGTGKSVLVWSNQGASGWYVIRSASQSGTTWGPTETLSLPGNYNAFFPKVRFDAQGNGLAVWTQGSTLPGAGLWSARYVQGQGWQPPVVVDANLASVQEPSVAMDAAGNAVVAWVKPIGPSGTGNADVFAACFTPAGGWQAPVRLGSDANIGTYDQASQPDVVVDAAGNAYVLWVQNASDHPVWFARYQAGTGWQPATDVGAVRRGDPYGPRVAVSSTGQVVAVWSAMVHTGGLYRFDLWSSVLATPTGTWSSPALLETDDAGNAFHQQVAADSTGNVHVIWQQFANDYKSRLQHRQYTATGWTPAITVSTADGAFDNNLAPSLVADRNGNLMALWGVYASGNGGSQEGTFARRYIPGEGWQPVVRVGLAGGVAAFNTTLAVGHDGAIAAGWMEPDPYRSDGQVWVNLLK